MNRARVRVGWLRATAALMSFTGGTLAQPAEQQAAMGAPAPQVERETGSLGIMLFLGGNMFTTPDNRRIEPNTGAESDGLGFSGDAGGFGWGLGAYGEVRVMEHLGLHFGVGYDQSILSRDVDFTRINATGTSSTVVLEERMTMRSLRFPMLVKGIVPTTFGRVWAGVGPEVVATRWVEAEIDPADNVTGTIHARKASSLMLAFGLGCVFDVGDSLELPIELRASRNLSQGSDWADRVDSPQDPTYNPYTVKAQSTWDFRLGLGLGLRF